MGSQEAKSDEVCLFFLIAMFSLKKTLYKIGLKTRICGIKKKEVENSQRVSAYKSTSKSLRKKNGQRKVFGGAPDLDFDHLSG